MSTIKSYTDLSQSKKLAEILPLESADMFYDGVQDLYKEKVYNIPIDGSSITVRTGHIITEKGIKTNLLLPCWSLASLLGVLPNDTSLLYFDDAYQMVYDKKPYVISNKFDNPVDACYDMILKLNKLKML